MIAKSCVSKNLLTSFKKRIQINKLKNQIFYKNDIRFFCGKSDDPRPGRLMNKDCFHQHHFDV